MSELVSLGIRRYQYLYDDCALIIDDQDAPHRRDWNGLFNGPFRDTQLSVGLEEVESLEDTTRSFIVRSVVRLEHTDHNRDRTAVRQLFPAGKFEPIVFASSFSAEITQSGTPEWDNGRDERSQVGGPTIFSRERSHNSSTGELIISEIRQLNYARYISDCLFALRTGDATDIDVLSVVSPELRPIAERYFHE